MDPKALENDAEVFLKLGDLYEMEALKDLAERKMMDNLSTDNMVKFFLVGDQYKAEGLRMKAKDLIKCNIKMLKKKEGKRLSDSYKRRPLLASFIRVILTSQPGSRLTSCVQSQESRVSCVESRRVCAGIWLL